MFGKWKILYKIFKEYTAKNSFDEVSVKLCDNFTCGETQERAHDVDIQFVLHVLCRSQPMLVIAAVLHLPGILWVVQSDRYVGI